MSAKTLLIQKCNKLGEVINYILFESVIHEPIEFKKLQLPWERMKKPFKFLN